MTLRLPFSCTNSRFSMYCVTALAIIFEAAGGAYLLELRLCLRHIVEWSSRLESEGRSVVWVVGAVRKIFQAQVRASHSALSYSTIPDYLRYPEAP